MDQEHTNSQQHLPTGPGPQYNEIPGPSDRGNPIRNIQPTSIPDRKHFVEIPGPSDRGNPIRSIQPTSIPDQNHFVASILEYNQATTNNLFLKIARDNFEGRVIGNVNYADTPQPRGNKPPTTPTTSRGSTWPSVLLPQDEPLRVWASGANSLPWPQISRKQGSNNASHTTTTDTEVKCIDVELPRPHSQATMRVTDSGHTIVQRHKSDGNFMVGGSTLPSKDNWANPDQSSTEYREELTKRPKQGFEDYIRPKNNPLYFQTASTSKTAKCREKQSRDLVTCHL